jgi:hypothetical protein
MPTKTSPAARHALMLDNEMRRWEAKAALATGTRRDDCLRFALDYAAQISRTHVARIYALINAR